MVTESALQQALASYLSGELSLPAFDEWIAIQTWDMHRSSPEQAQELAGAIELRLAEYSECRGAAIPTGVTDAAAG